ncbi:hypothetical protein SB444474_5455, partial [Shigella boydii 4444-74]
MPSTVVLSVVVCRGVITVNLRAGATVGDGA